MSDLAERALLAERILAEQEERRRLGDLLHDGAVQQLSALAQMLDAGLSALRANDLRRADETLSRALALARDATRDLRALCDDLEPRALREAGFVATLGALARRVATRHAVEVDLDVDEACELGEHAQAA
ncbi:MAG: histidine kinase, partial [Thermoleophilia bacterium]|nr:histidine kinase [Thermoleophilia bacterium]